MVDQNLEIIEITLTVITPRSGELLLDVGVASLLLAHCSWVGVMYVCRSKTASLQEQKLGPGVVKHQGFDEMAGE